MAMKNNEKQILSLKLEAKQALKMKDMRKARLVMSKIKMHRKETKKLECANFILEQQVFQIKTQGHNVDVFNALGEGNKAIAQLVDETDINKFEDIKEKHEELQDRNDEIDDFFTDFANEQSEDCEEDLAALEAEMIDSEDEGIQAYYKPIGGTQSKPKKERKSKEVMDLLAQMN